MKRNTVIIDGGKGLWYVFFILLVVFCIQKGLNQGDTVVHFVWLLRPCYELEGPKHEGELQFNVRHPFVINVGHLIYSEKNTKQPRISLDPSK